MHVHAATAYALFQVEVDLSSVLEHCLVTTDNVLRGRKCTTGSSTTSQEPESNRPSIDRRTLPLHHTHPPELLGNLNNQP